MPSIISVRRHNPIAFADGSIERVRVVLLDADRHVLNTGRGFATMVEADLFADGMGMGLGAETLREEIDERV